MDKDQQLFSAHVKIKEQEESYSKRYDVLEQQLRRMTEQVGEAESEKLTIRENYEKELEILQTLVNQQSSQLKLMKQQQQQMQQQYYSASTYQTDEEKSPFKDEEELANVDVEKLVKMLK